MKVQKEAFEDLQGKNENKKKGGKKEGSKEKPVYAFRAHWVYRWLLAVEVRHPYCVERHPYCVETSVCFGTAGRR
jgi:hypothetical protein